MWLFAVALAEDPPPPPAPVMDIAFTSERVISRVLPAFPDAAARDGVRTAGCQVRVYIDEEGVPYRALPVLCDEAFVPDTVAAALQWRFHPYLEEGVARKARFTVLFVYENQAPPVPPP